MLILSKFYDYYDPIAKQYGVDKSIIFKRQESEIYDTIENKVFIDFLHGVIKKITYLDFPIPGEHQWLVIGFCGELYPLIKVYPSYNSSDAKPSYYYMKDIISIIEEDMSNIKNKNKKIPYLRTLETLDMFKKMDVTNIFRELQSPIFIFEIETFKYSSMVSIVNPCLANYDFFKEKDSFSAFQEIQQYISGVLGTGNNEPIETDEKYKIVAAGFDLKTSFRKDKKV